MWFKRPLDRFKYPLYQVVESVWAFLFSISRIFIWKEGTFSKWKTGGKTRILIVSPHPDDESIGCGGVIQLHKKAGDCVTLVEVTDGSASPANGLSPQQMRATRKGEVEQVSTLLGVDNVVFLSFPEGKWHDRELADVLTRIMESERPDIVYTPSCLDYHPEHQKVATVLASVLSELSYAPIIRIYEIHVPLMPVLVNVIADISEVSHTKRSILRMYQSQADALRPIDRHLRYTEILYGLKAGVEVFIELSSQQFLSFNKTCLDLLRNTRLRRTHPRPFSDLLVYLAGRKIRKELRRELHEGRPIQATCKLPESV